MNTNFKLQKNNYFLKTSIFLFLFGSAQLLLAQSPGGVSGDLSVWLKADSEVFSDTGTTNAVNNGTVQQWNDQFGSGNFGIISGTSGPTYLNDITNTLNFNPQVSFNGSQALESSVLANYPSGNSARLMRVVATPTATFSGDDIVFGHGDPSDTRAHLMAGRQTGSTLVYGSWGAANDRIKADFWELDTPVIAGGRFNGSTTFIDKNGVEQTGVSGNPTWNTLNTIARIGADVSVSPNLFFTGTISEVIVYDANISATDQQKIDSYLALKYGIEMEQDYLASDGTTDMWVDDSDGYDSDIFGIGRDDDSGLDQRVSKSVNANSILTLALEADFTSANTARSTAHDNNLQFLTLANNGETTAPQFNEIDGVTYNVRASREWKVDKTANFTQNISLKFEGFDETWSIIATADGDFSTGITTIGTLNTNGEFTTTAPVTNGVHITLAKSLNVGPGGVVSNLELWLKADAGFTYNSITNAEWLDQSPNGLVLNANLVQGPDADSAPSFEANGVNFNSGIVFDGVDTGMATAVNAADFGFTEWSVFSMQQALPGFSHCVWHYNDNGQNTLALFMDPAAPRDFTVTVNSSSAVELESPLLDDNVPHLFGFTADNTSSETYVDADEVNITLGQSPLSGNGAFMVGLDADGAEAQDGNNHFNGNLGEVLMFSKKLSALDRQKVQSYLALKYGVSLDQSTTTDYIASDGTTIFWDASENTGYNNDIFGIGRDDNSALNQFVSKSVNDGGILTLDLESDFTTANTDGSRSIVHAADKQFLMVAHNNGATTTQTTELDAVSGFNTRIVREWKVDVTNFTQNISLKFEGYDDSWSIISTADGDFSTGTTTIGALNSDGEFTTTSAIADGTVMTLAKFQEAPGGTLAGLGLWLKADQGAVGSSNMSQWTDQSPNNNNAVQATAGNQPAITENGLNFHNRVDFDGTNDMLTFGNDLGIVGTDAFTIFGMMEMPNVPAKTAILATDGCGDGFAWYQENIGGSPGTIAVTQCGTAGAFGNPAIAGETTLRTVTRANSGAHDFFKEGGNKVTGTGLNYTSQNMALGNTNGIFSDIRLSELIVFNTALNATERQQVHSYLALKYGTTLDQTVATDYLASDGTAIWNATNNAGYNNDIFGIGRDDAQALNQKISESINDDTILTIALDADFTVANNDATRTTEHTNDKQFLVVANNGEALTNQFTELEATTGFNTRLAREWKVNATNFSQNLSLKFEGYDESWSIIATSDGNFSAGVATVGSLNADGEFTNTAPIADGTTFTLAKLQKAPGGVLVDLQLWLSADDNGTTTTNGATVTNWSNKGFAANGDFSISAGDPSYQDDVASTLNFNPVIDFDGSDYFFNSATNFGLTGLEAHTYAVIGKFTGNGALIDQHGFFAPNAVVDPPFNGLEFTMLDSSDELRVNLYGTTGVANEVINRDRPNIFGASRSSGGLGSSYVNGEVTTHNTTSQLWNSSVRYYVGASHSTAILVGTMPELLVYDRELSTTERQRVESYLAIKYGMSLDQSTATDYVASNGTVIWDASENTGYTNTIFGIGRDDASGLSQKVSKSVETGTMLTISLDANFTVANNDATRTTEHTNDKQFLVVANNAAATTSQTTELEAATGFNIRIAREWKVDATNFTQNVSLKFDGYDETWSIITTADGDFSTGVTTVGALNSNGEFTTTTPLTDGTTLTLAKLQTGPGGVLSNLSLWVKADAGATGATWANQAGSGNAVQVNTASRPTPSTTQLLNFNPSMVFDGVNDYLRVERAASLIGTSSLSTFYITETNAGSAYIYSHGTGGGANFGSPTNSWFYPIHEENNALVLKGWGDGISGTSISYVQYDRTQLFNNIYDTTTGDLQTFADGEIDIDITTVTNLNRISTDDIIGAARSNDGAGGSEVLGGFYNGKIGEVIGYAESLSSTEVQKVNSYLALKYGISLNQTVALDYLASDATVIWDASENSGYTSGIFGIGRDDASGLVQKVSKSINDGSILNIALDADFTVANNDAARTTEHTNDRQFLVVANNGAATTPQTTELEAATGFNIRIAREWKVDATNFTQNVSLKFNGYDETWSIIATADGDFSTGVTTVGALNADGEFTNTAPIADGTTFTLAKFQEAPGGVTLDLTLWLKADEGVTDSGNTVTDWQDQTGTNSFSVSGNPTTNTNNLNLNNTIAFDGAGDFMTGNTAIDFKNGYAVYKLNTNDNSTLLSANSPESGNIGYFLKSRQLTSGDNSVDGNQTYVTTDGDMGADFRIASMDIMAGQPATSTEAFIDGAPLVTSLLVGSGTMGVHNSVPFMGRSQNNGVPDYLNGEVAEIIMYDSSHTNLQRNQIESYLALKYGITLDQTTPKDYIASDATTIWDASANIGYTANILGIGRDDASGLNQKVSRSVNDGTVLSIALDANFTAANNDGARSTEHINDNQFFVVANNGAATTSQTTELEASTGFNTRIAREWKVDATNFTQNVNIKFDGYDETWSIIATADGDFSTAVTTIGALNSDGEFTTTTAISDGTTFTLAKFQEAPGGVLANNQLWLRADKGVTGTTDVTWTDQTSTNGDTFPNFGSPELIEIGSNFNPAIRFDGNNDYFKISGGAANVDFATGGMDVFYVTKDWNEGTSVLYMGANDAQNGLCRTWGQKGVHQATVLGQDDATPGNIDWLSNNGNSTVHLFNHSSIDPGTTNFIDDTYYAEGAIITPTSGGSANRIWARNTDNVMIGNSRDNTDSDCTSCRFGGSILEVIAYSTNNSIADKQRISSYLALKYGITLDQTATTDYLASDGTTVFWDASENTGYNNDIFGIGRDDASGLNQKVSKSVNDNSILTFALDANFTAANNDGARIINHNSDLQFLVAANNGATTDLQATELEASTGFNARIAREWKVDATNFTQNVNIKFDGYDETWSIIATADGDFSTGVTTVGALNADGEFTNTAPIADGTVFTLAKFQEAPGGITTDLKLWLKAGAGVTYSGGNSIETWTDQTDNSYVFTSPNTDPTITSGGINFNSVVTQVSGADNLQNSNSDFGADTEVTFFGIVKNDTGASLYQNAFQNDDVSFTAEDGGSWSYWDDTNNVDSGISLNDNPAIIRIQTTGNGSAGAGYTNGGNPFTGGTPQNERKQCNFTTIGSNCSGSGQDFAGHIGEYIMYTSELSTSDIQKIETYLAVKYGVTLSQTAPTDYIASDATVIWDASENTGYNNDIFGIGRDDASGLNQKVSKSVNDNSILTFALDANFTAANNDGARITNHNSDLQFLVVANNGATTDLQATELEASTGFNARIAREWKVDVTGFTQNVNIKFDGYDETWSIIATADGDFSTGVTTVGALNADGEFTNTAPIADGTVFTLAKFQEAPGGELTDLTIWLKAGSGTQESGSAVTTDGTIDRWFNQAINNVTFFTHSEAADDVSLLTNTLNFNSIVHIDEDDRMHVAGTSNPDDYLDSDSNSAYIIYTQNSDVAGADVIFQFENGDGDERFNLENNPVEFGSPINRSVIASTTFTNGTYNMLSLIDTDNAGGDTNTIYINGAENAQANSSGDIDLSGSRLSLGAREINDNHSDINIAEFIIFENEHDQTTRNKIESYLALKYGFNLDQTTATDYVSSDATVIWDASENTGYATDIFGIGRDNASGLNQKVSKSVNNINAPILATTQNFTVANQDAARTTSIGDGNFVILSHNNASDATFNASYDGGTGNRSARVWKVTETGTVGPVFIAIPKAAYTFPTGIPAVVLSDDTTFGDSDTTVNLTDDGTHYWAAVNPNDGDYMAFASAIPDFTVSETTLTINENAGEGTFTVVLATEPLSDVVLTITSDDTDEATVDLATLTFTTANWNTPQTITVTGVDDGDTGNDTATITVAINDAASDDNFDALADKTVAVTLTDDEIGTAANGSEISSADGTATADNSDTETITIQLKNDSGDDLAYENVEVTFSVTGSAVLSSTTATTDASGIATVTLTNSLAETVDVTATINSDRDDGTTPEVALTNGSPAQITFETSGTIDDGANGTEITSADGSATSNGSDTETISIQLKDEFGNNIETAGIDITFSVTGSAVLSNTTATTNASGIATITLTNTVEETVSLIATGDFDNNGGTTQTSVSNGSPVLVVFSTSGTQKFLLDAITDANVDENTAYTGPTPNATGNPVGNLIYTLSGTDAADFTINSGTGVVSMVARDFENPEDGDTDNVYEVTVTATDEDDNTDSEDWTVTVDNVTETVSFTIDAIADANVDENSVYTGPTPSITGSPIGDVTYTLSGTDAADFTIVSATGVVSMVARDFENPEDGDTDNVYEVTTTATDEDNNSDSEDWTVTVDNVTETVSFTIDAIANANADENSAYTSVTPNLSGDTPIGDVTYTLSGTDAADFTIVSTTGVVSMVARDFENPEDDNTNNGYEVTITATDEDNNTDSEDWIVTVDNVTETVSFTIDAIADANVDENNAYTGATPSITGSPIGDVTYTLSGTDAADFTIVGTTGVVSMVARDFENPEDGDTDNTYEVTITATDEDDNSDSEDWTVTVDNVTETVSFDIDAIADANVDENSAYTGSTPNITGSPIGNVTYTLSGTDAADFTINSSTGVTSMVARNFENPEDANTDNVYELTITATDEDNNTDSEDWTVTVDNVTETVSFDIDAIADTNVDENSAYTGATPSITGSPIGNVTYTLSGTDAADFTINSSTGVTSMVARNFENPEDANTDNVYELTITATDDDGNSDSESWTVTVDDVIETVSFDIDAIADTNVDENSAYTGATPSITGSPIGDVTYTLSGADAADFTIVGATGVVSMVARDFENPEDADTDNVYEVTVTATDEDDNTDSEDWTVTVDNVTETVSFTIDAIADANVDENAAYTSSTPNITGSPIGNITYTLGGTDASDFTINSTTGVVSMVARNFENPEDANTDNVYEVTITATDEDNNSDSEDWTVTVDNVTETVSFVIDAIADTNVDENSAYTSATPNITGSLIGNVTYTLGGTDAADFTIDSSTGVVSMVARDFENPEDANTDNIYEVTITATDEDGNSDTEDWTVTVNNLTETASFTIDAIANANVNENSPYTSTTPSITGSPIGDVTYTLSGTDADDFTINASTGVVAMVARDFENPVDSNSDNLYEVTITATDDDGNTDSEAWTVTVDNVTETASFTIDTIADANVNENSPYTSTTPSITGSPIGTVTYALGGADASDFTIDASTGVVAMVARDFENPEDDNTDNSYEVTITATDEDNNTYSESWTVTVLDSNETGPDADGDGISDDLDNCPSMANADQLDTNGDGEGDICDDDDDGDGIPDDEDADVDGDGILDNGTDTDGDGINDANDTTDDRPDSDGDGVPDEEDAFPNDPDESVDNDGDGVGSNADQDDNNSQVGEEPTVVSAEAFTPNGDGINDTWMIQGIENHPNALVTVYNRYGHEVFKAIGYQNDWSGRASSRSENLPAGSYYYVIDFRNGTSPKDGWIFINY